MTGVPDRLSHTNPIRRRPSAVDPVQPERPAVSHAGRVVPWKFLATMRRALRASVSADAPAAWLFF